jgi:hypothetical protein
MGSPSWASGLRRKSFISIIRITNNLDNKISSATVTMLAPFKIKYHILVAGNVYCIIVTLLVQAVVLC